jgi:hypothetical protein
MKKVFKIGLIISSLVIFSSWGFLVHRTVNQLAIYQLPKKMQPFFYRNIDSIVKYSIRPDQRRSQDPTEAPKHFIDLEAYGDSAAWKMPVTWNEAVAKFSRDTLIKYGYVPYWIMAMKEKLTNAFRSQNGDSILFYATDIGHYIGDANVPLHTSINYDGQLTGQRGLHALWESVIPELELDQWKFYNHHKAKYLDHPENEIWEAIRDAHGLVNDMIQKEREVSKQFTDATKYRIQNRNGRDVKLYTQAFAKAYATSLQLTINEQLIRSSNLIADMWFSSWVDAGKPDLSAILKTQLSKNEKKKMKGEFKAYKKEELIKRNLLISKRDAVVDPANQ